MKISGNGDKPNLGLLDSAVNSSEAVKVSTRSSSQAQSARAQESELLKQAPVAGEDQGISVELGLAKYINQVLDPETIRQERLAKIEDIKKRISEGNYLSSVASDKVAEKFVEESRIEFLEYKKFASNE
jgi:anti-sigma28 factor (negative regulator of flagellin synthesis)